MNHKVENQKPKLLDQVRQTLRRRHYAYQTEKTYIHWIKRYILFHHKRHPQEMGEREDDLHSCPQSGWAGRSKPLG